MHNNLQQDQVNEEPPVSVSVLQVHSLYNLYRIEIAKQKYVAKVYPPTFLNNSQREANILERLNHPNIIKPVNLSHTLTAKLAAIFQSEVLLFPEAAHSSLLNYIQANSPVSENVCKFFLSQIVSALVYAESEGVSHPNLTIDNVLVEQNYNLLLGGWSNSNNAKKDLLFGIAVIGINLLTGRSPFVCKEIKIDPYGKFLSDKLIHKFWEQSEKLTRRKNKKFVYSEEFKNIFSALLLGKINSLPKLAQSYLKQGVITYDDASKELLEQENMMKQKRAQKHLEQKRQRLEEQALTVQGEVLALNRQSSRCNDFFLEEYKFLKDEAQIKIPQKSDTSTREYFQLFNNDLCLILAHLKVKLNEACLKQKEEWFVDPLLVLRTDSNIEIEGNEIKVHLSFGWNLSEIESNEGLSAVSISVSIVLGKEKDALWGSFGQIECSDLQPVCVRWVTNWLREAIEFYA